MKRLIIFFENLYWRWKLRKYKSFCRKEAEYMAELNKKLNVAMRDYWNTTDIKEVEQCFIDFPIGLQRPEPPEDVVVTDHLNQPVKIKEMRWRNEK